MTRVRDEEVNLAVAAVVRRGDAHAGVGVVDSEPLADVLEAEPERTRARHVAVQLVRVGVVRDVEIEASVAVDVRERRAETVRYSLLLDARRSGNPPNVDRPVLSRPSLR